MLKKTGKILLYSLIAFFLSSCVTSKKMNYLQKPGFNIPTYKDTVQFSDYMLRIGDRVYIKVYSTDETANLLFNAGNQNTEQSTMSNSGPIGDLYTYLIDSDGDITFPMLGKIKLSTLTIREASQKLETVLEPLFKFNTVEIRVTNRSFSVIGNGNSAYINMPQEKINIFKALALAGDVGIYDDRSRIRILRETDKGVQIKLFDLRSADLLHSEYYYIEPNDVIYIQPLDEQFFRVNNLTGLASTVVATFSFGVLLYESVINPKETTQN